MCLQVSWIVGSFFLLIVLLCRPGEATSKCYICSTKDDETGCLYPKWYDLPAFRCDQTALDKTREIAKKVHLSYDRIFQVDAHDMARNLDLVCLKVVTRIGTKSYTFRGCQLAEQASTDICHKMKLVDADYLKLQNCSMCNTDLCNSAHTSIKNGLYVIVSVIVPLLIVNF